MMPEKETMVNALDALQPKHEVNPKVYFGDDETATVTSVQSGRTAKSTSTQRSAWMIRSKKPSPLIKKAKVVSKRPDKEEVDNDSLSQLTSSRRVTKTITRKKKSLQNRRTSVKK